MIITSESNKQVKKTSFSKKKLDIEGVLLHRYPYKETSLLLDMFTKDYGRVILLAKGAKRPHSALRPVLLNFQELAVSWSGNNEIKTLVSAETTQAPRILRGDALMSAWYLNELLLRFLAKEDPHPRVFEHYIETLDELTRTSSVAMVLRAFEWCLLQESGYAFDPMYTECGDRIHESKGYVINPGGGVLLPSINTPEEHLVPGHIFHALDAASFDDLALEPYLRRIFRAKLQYHMSGKALESRRVFQDLQSY